MRTSGHAPGDVAWRQQAGVLVKLLTGCWPPLHTRAWGGAAAGQALGSVHHRSMWMGLQQHERLTWSQPCLRGPHLVQSDLAGLTLLPLPSWRPEELVLLWRVPLLCRVPSEAAAW